MPPEQQAAPSVPHATHIPFEHVLPEAVQVSVLILPASTPPPQQAWPMPPHAVFVVGSVHEPVAEQVPLIPLPVHSSPTATQVSVVRRPDVTGMQQPLSVQTLPAQHGWPDSPQAVPPSVEPIDASRPLAPPRTLVPPAPVLPPVPSPPVPDVPPPGVTTPPCPVKPPAPELPPVPPPDPPPHAASSKAIIPAHATAEFPRETIFAV